MRSPYQCDYHDNDNENQWYCCCRHRKKTLIVVIIIVVVVVVVVIIIIVIITAVIYYSHYLTILCQIHFSSFSSFFWLVFCHRVTPWFDSLIRRPPESPWRILADSFFIAENLKAKDEMSSHDAFLLEEIETNQRLTHLFVNVLWKDPLFEKLSWCCLV